MGDTLREQLRELFVYFLLIFGKVIILGIYFLMVALK